MRSSVNVKMVLSLLTLICLSSCAPGTSPTRSSLDSVIHNKVGSFFMKESDGQTAIAWKESFHKTAPVRLYIGKINGQGKVLNYFTHGTPQAMHFSKGRIRVLTTLLTRDHTLEVRIADTNKGVVVGPTLPADEPQSFAFDREGNALIKGAHHSFTEKNGHFSLS